MYEVLKHKVWEANMELVRQKLVLYTWGNASGIDRGEGVVVIKPSGVEYNELTPEMMVVLDLDGIVLEGKLKPSSDTPTHLCLYRNFPEIGGVVHTHSSRATAWAQAAMGIPYLGTTHADYFHGEIPCTRALSLEETAGAYEWNTGEVIVERFSDLNYQHLPGVLVAHHGPFTWGKDAAEAAYHSAVLEEVAYMALTTLQIRAAVGLTLPIMPRDLLDRHFLRKHGENAYYGQISK